MAADGSVFGGTLLPNSLSTIMMLMVRVIWVHLVRGRQILPQRQLVLVVLEVVAALLSRATR